MKRENWESNKLQMDAAIWLFKFLLNKVTPKDTKSHTSLEHALKQVTYGHFYTAWYTLFYACYPRTAPMFDVSKSIFYQISLPPGHDLERLETEINNRRFNWKLSHAGADVGEDECLKAVVFAMAGATGLDDESERLRLEVQNNPNMTAHAAIQFVKVLIQSKKASDTLTSEAKAYAGQTNTSSASQVLADNDDAEVDNTSSYKKFNKKRKQVHVSKSEFDYPPAVYRYYVRNLGLQLRCLSAIRRCTLGTLFVEGKRPDGRDDHPV